MYKRKSLFSRHETIEIVKSFVKEETYNSKADVIIFYRLLKEYPNESFWRNYSLDFKLNSMAFFLTEDGKHRLLSDYSIFNLDLGSPTVYNVEDAKIGDDALISKSKNTISDLLK
jgi:hypothetical protein